MLHAVHGAAPQQARVPQDWHRETSWLAWAARGSLWAVALAWLCHPPPAASITARFPAQLQPVLHRAVGEHFQLTPLAEQKALGKQPKKPREYKSVFCPLPFGELGGEHLPKGCPNSICVSTVQTFYGKTLIYTTTAIALCSGRRHLPNPRNNKTLELIKLNCSLVGIF